MAIEFRVMTEEEIAAAEIKWERSAEEQAEHDRLVRVCAEGDGHDWELHLYDPEDDAFVALMCTRCPAGTDDLYPDGSDLIYAELDTEVGSVSVEAGKHDALVALIVPVIAVVEASKSWTDCGWEYDAWIEIEQRGPAREMVSGSRPLALPEVGE